MRFLAILVLIASVFGASGCRHDYNPTPPPYYCQPAGCGCAPVAPVNPCAPACPPGTAPVIPRPAALYPAPAAPAAPYVAPGTPYAPAQTYGAPANPATIGAPPR